MIQAHIFYSGMVQGVGFRYTVQRCTDGRALAGWVRNLSDGRVEILVEGEKDGIEGLMKAVEDHFGGYISKKDVSYTAASQEFRGFHIARS